MGETPDDVEVEMSKGAVEEKVPQQGVTSNMFFWAFLFFLLATIGLTIGLIYVENNKTTNVIFPPSACPTSYVAGLIKGTDFLGAGGAAGGSGIGAITTNARRAAADWAPWGVSVSGNGLMAEAAAFGTLRSLSQAGILPQLTSIASVSGGSWFNTQFGFSSTYYSGVTGTANIREWYVNYQNAASAKMTVVMKAGIPYWEAVISAMLDGWDATVPSKPAINANRAGNTVGDMLICTTLIGQSLMSDKATLVQMASGGQNSFYSVPAFWAIPTSGTESWNVPSVNMTDATWTVNASLKTSDASAMLPTPTVSKIAASSSAANGGTGNIQLFNSITPAGYGPKAFGGGINPDNAVCLSETGYTCSAPGQMAMDGCYNDNLGFALNVGYLQKKHPGKNLRMIGVSSLVCDRTTDPTCLNGVKVSSFRSLFANSPYPTTEGWLPINVPGPNRTIFAESITDEQALGQQTGIGGMTFVTGTFTTIKNDMFGVAAGTKVSLIVLNVNGPTYLQATNKGQTEAFGRLAEYASTSWNNLFAALSTTGKLDSSAAFLYYGDTPSS